ncbi:hypothetical protein SCLCIDRAFT_1218995 [Scleroderma citrinum Foug A]|uniref:Thioesterase domain-containing protein n=1 Tax=Scleroderma citrinum Foug A TaxID=1036808 RepID=A0A0C2Z7I3_9AGAM|nr:hypothetical protein SCLCIDRAFT_1218995 [Scleroderma citrinum Foug A]
MSIERLKILESLPLVAAHNVPGNASATTKARVAKWLFVLTNSGFGARSAKALELVDVSILPKADEPLRQEARVVLETTVTDEMLDSYGKMHGACIIHLVDICSTLPVIAMSHAQGGAGSPGVSQNISTVFHAPASLGDKLKLVTTSKTVGPHTASAQIDIWDTTHHRLVASATQVKMEASTPKL